MSMSKKQALTLGLLAIGGIGVATMVSGAGSDAEGQGATMEGLRGRAGGILGSTPTGGESFAPKAFQIPTQKEVRFPEQIDYTDFLARFLSSKEAVSRGTQGVSSAGKKKIIYGGYKPSGQTYVFGGKTFTAQAAKEVTQLGYSPTLGAAFGISPEIAMGEGYGTPKKEQVLSSGGQVGSMPSMQAGHTVSASGMHTVTSVSSTGVVSKKAYR